MKRVTVFGTFDGIHEGHRAFLKEARCSGDHLTVVLPGDEVVQRLKGRTPKRSLDVRMADLRREPYVDEVLAGDREPGSWSVLRRTEPDLIAIGHDQDLLKKDLEEHIAAFDKKPEILVMTYHERSLKG